VPFTLLQIDFWQIGLHQNPDQRRAEATKQIAQVNMVFHSPPPQLWCLVRGHFMTKTALLFAGQGAQFMGMGKDLVEAYPSARQSFERAKAALGYDLGKICFAGPEPELTKTEHAQPGIFLVSWVAWELLKEKVRELSFQAAAGLSL